MSKMVELLVEYAPNFSESVSNLWLKMVEILVQNVPNVQKFYPSLGPIQ